MTREIRVIRTNAVESMSLAISNAILTVMRMATGRVKILMGVARLGAKITYQSITLLTDGNIQEVFLLVTNY